MRSIFHHLILGLVTSFTAFAANRDVQITTVDFETSVLTLENLGEATESLSGWRFCSHDEDQVRRYTAAGDLNGRSLEPGDVLHVHFLDDAPAGDAEHIDISAFGGSGFAEPLDRGPYGIQIYFQTSFGVGANIADHLQWSIDGVDNTSADERSDEAETGGVWVDQGQWIATAADSTTIRLNDLSGAELHSPSDYMVTAPIVEPLPFDLESIESAANGAVTITWPVEEGAEYEILRGTTLESFAPIGITNEGTFTDSAPPAGRAFYRVVASFPR